MSSPLEKLREFCRTFSNDPELRRDPYSLGFVTGALTVMGLDWKDLCGGCEGCEAPICPPKRFKELR